MALYADIANRSRTNSLRMARPTRRKTATQRRLTAKIKRTVQTNTAQSRRDAAYKKREEAKNRKVTRFTPIIDRAKIEQAARLKNMRALEARSNRRLDNRYAGSESVQNSRVRRALSRITQEAGVLKFLSPEAKARLAKEGMKISLNAEGTQPNYNPFFKTVNIPVDLPADAIRHEMMHAGLALTPDLFPDVSDASKFANSALGTFLGNVTSFFPDQMMLAETPAITMGGASAYGGWQASNRPDQFSNFFNTKDPSWKYRDSPGWNITKESKWKTYR